MRSHDGRFPELSSPGGTRHMLVPATQVLRWSEPSALAVLRAVIADSPLETRTLVDLALARGCRSSAPDDVAAFLAREIASGALTAVALPEPPPRGRPVLYRSEAPPDWDNLQPLSDLIETDPSTELTWVSIEVLDHRGVPFAGLDVTLVHGDGRRDRVVLDERGRYTARALVPGGHTRVYWPAAIELPAEKRVGQGIDGFVRGPEDLVVPRRPQGRAVTLPQMARHYRVIVEAPAVAEVLIDGWAEGAKVMRWGGMRPRVDGTLATTRAALRVALWRGRGRTMAFAGHTDPLGQDADNDALSLERAVSVHLFAAGRLDEWAEHAFAHATDLDLRCAMVACHTILGLGPTSLDDAEALEAARSKLRDTAGLPEEGPSSVAEWRAIADAYDGDLAQMFVTDRAGLAEVRGAVRWADPPAFGVGERYPRAPDELDDREGPTSLAHRRGSLLVLEDADAVSLRDTTGWHAIYDGTFERTVVPVPAEALVEIVVATERSEASIARGRAWISIGDLGAAEHIAGSDGSVRFTALEGDRIVVLAAFDSNGLGTMVSAVTD